MGRRVKGLSFGRKKERRINLSLFQEVIIWIFEIAITIGIAVVFTFFFGVRSSVVGPSMSPQLEDGDEVLIDRFSYKFISPKPGDVIAFLPNGNVNTHYYIKRVIAVPGDKIQIIDGVVNVNDEKYVEDLEPAYIDDAGIAKEAITLGEDEYFVLGDNRNNSEDSRFANIGNVREDYIIGRVWFISSPRDKFGFIK
ncbi:MAG: signal peptidase I [Eubacterium sp.]|nr:signal peptidase I [Eubacterium sp.]